MKKNDIQKATFQRYLEASGIIRKLFGNIQLKDMNDIVVQRKIDEYAKKRSHSTTRSLLIKVKMALRDAYARGYLTNDFAEH
ncbi:site-specific integrase, partial [Bacillus haynesii]|nr:site-specific integrase [Bacillus haynesii]